MNTTTDKLVIDYIPLAISIAIKFYSRLIKFMEYEDIKQESCLLLVKAAGTYNASLNFAFTTYATHVISNGLCDLIRVFYSEKYYNDNGIASMELILEQSASGPVVIKESIEQHLVDSEVITFLKDFAAKQPVAIQKGVSIILHESVLRESHPDRKLAPNYAKTNVYKSKQKLRASAQVVDYFKGVAA